PTKRALIAIECPLLACVTGVCVMAGGAPPCCSTTTLVIASGSLGGLTMIFFSASRSAGRGLSDEPARAGIAAGSGVAAGAAAGGGGHNESHAFGPRAAPARVGSARAGLLFFRVFFAAFCR